MRRSSNPRSSTGSRALSRVLDRFTFGGRLPGGVGIILAVTLVSSLLAAFGSRQLVSFFALLSLVPEDVLHGQLWRLVSWSFVQPALFGLVWACLGLYWFGRDLAQEWGSRRFFLVYLSVALLAAFVTCLLSLVDPLLREQSYLGSGPLAAAVMVAWGLWFPQRQIRIYFIIPVKGIVVAWGTVAITVGYAIYNGWAYVLPHLAAEGSMLAWLYRGPAVRWWERQQRARANNARLRVTRTKTAKRNAAVHVLYKLEEQDEDLPPLSPEMEGQMSAIFDEAARAARTARKKGEDEPS